MNPGPVTLTPRVRGALLGDDMCHREPEFASMQLRVRAALEKVYPEAASDCAAILLTGSGTAAVEAMVGSLVPRDGRALVVANGVYGDRIGAMLTAQGKRFETVASDWLADIDLAAVEARLAADPGITHVLAVHHETTTGRLNSIAALGALCKRYGRPLLLDGVSSFGGEDIQFAEWNLEAVAGTANKCLHGGPGISFVLVKRAVLAANRTSGATSVYLDLFRHWKEQQNGFSPFTQSVQVVYALEEALAELDAAGGWKARHAEYQRRAVRVRGELRELGVKLFLAGGDAVYSSILTSFEVPAHVPYDRLHDELRARGFVIYAGQGPYLGRMFRIAVMGDLTASDMDELVSGLRAILSRPPRSA
ncbi:MAG: pyridoxal-phosphate-dependent aminotransferase family protein [Polyangiaceae bacterium]